MIERSVGVWRCLTEWSVRKRGSPAEPLRALVAAVVRFDPNEDQVHQDEHAEKGIPLGLHVDLKTQRERGSSLLLAGTVELGERHGEG